MPVVVGLSEGGLARGETVSTQDRVVRVGRASCSCSGETARTVTGIEIGVDGRGSCAIVAESVEFIGTVISLGNVTTTTLVSPSNNPCARVTSSPQSPTPLFLPVPLPSPTAVTLGSPTDSDSAPTHTSTTHPLASRVLSPKDPVARVDLGVVMEEMVMLMSEEAGIGWGREMVRMEELMVQDRVRVRGASMLHWVRVMSMSASGRVSRMAPLAGKPLLVTNPSLRSPTVQVVFTLALILALTNTPLVVLILVVCMPLAMTQPSLLQYTLRPQLPILCTEPGITRPIRVIVIVWVGMAVVLVVRFRLLSESEDEVRKVMVGRVLMSEVELLRVTEKPDRLSWGGTVRIRYPLAARASVRVKTSCHWLRLLMVVEFVLAVKVQFLGSVVKVLMPCILGDPLRKTCNKMPSVGLVELGVRQVRKVMLQRVPARRVCDSEVWLRRSTRVVGLQVTVPSVKVDSELEQVMEVPGGKVTSNVSSRVTVSDRVKNKTRPILVLIVLMELRGAMVKVLRVLATMPVMLQLDQSILNPEGVQVVTLTASAGSSVGGENSPPTSKPKLLPAGSPLPVRLLNTTCSAVAEPTQLILALIAPETRLHADTESNGSLLMLVAQYSQFRLLKVMVRVELAGRMFWVVRVTRIEPVVLAVLGLKVTATAANRAGVRLAAAKLSTAVTSLPMVAVNGPVMMAGEGFTTLDTPNITLSTNCGTGTAPVTVTTPPATTTPYPYTMTPSTSTQSTTYAPVNVYSDGNLTVMVAPAGTDSARQGVGVREGVNWRCRVKMYWVGVLMVESAQLRLGDRKVKVLQRGSRSSRTKAGSDDVMGMQGNVL